jgi:hypothetical protein
MLRQARCREKCCLIRYTIDERGQIDQAGSVLVRGAKIKSVAEVPHIPV